MQKKSLPKQVFIKVNMLIKEAYSNVISLLKGFRPVTTSVKAYVHIRKYLGSQHTYYLDLQADGINENSPAYTRNLHFSLA